MTWWIDEHGRLYQGDMRVGDRAATQAEIDAVLNKPLTKQEKIMSKKEEISSLEAQQLLPRITREFILQFCETTYTPEQLAQNVGYTKLKAFDNQIVALRDEIYVLESSA